MLEKEFYKVCPFCKRKNKCFRIKDIKRNLWIIHCLRLTDIGKNVVKKLNRK